MFGYKRFVIARHERGLLFKDRSFQKILEPGVYTFVDPLNRVEVMRYDVSVVDFTHPQEDFLITEHAELVTRNFVVAELGERQVGLVYKNDKLTGILAPGTRQLYWKGPVTVRVELLDIAGDFRVPSAVAVLFKRPQLDSLVRDVKFAVRQVDIQQHQIGLLLIDGELKDTLRAGRHAFWKFQRDLEIEVVDCRLATLEVSGQEILTKDKVSLRLNLVANYVIKDPIAVRSAVVDVKDFLYRELQFGLRQAVGTRSLDELLANKGAMDKDVYAYASERAAKYGVELGSVGIKDVILPGEMKDILNQVVEAEKVAQANVIKRREETAATRSLLNTAKLMENNPTLLRLKELEMLEKVTGKIDKLTVFGGLEGLLSELVTLKTSQRS